MRDQHSTSTGGEFLDIRLENVGADEVEPVVSEKNGDVISILKNALTLTTDRTTISDISGSVHTTSILVGGNFTNDD
jgi:hypothetical protein